MKKKVFAVSLYKGQVECLPAPSTWENYLVYLIVLKNLQEVYGCSTVTDFMSIMFGSSLVFGS